MSSLSFAYPDILKDVRIICLICSLSAQCKTLAVETLILPLTTEMVIFGYKIFLQKVN